MQSIIFASAFLLLFTAQQGAALKCYICNSHQDKSCADDNPPANFLLDCRRKDGSALSKHESKQESPSTYCRKISQIIEFSVNFLPPDTRIIRSCGWKNQTSNNMCYQRAGFGGRQTVCSCETEGCNASGSLKYSYGLIFSTIIGLFFFVKAV